TTSVETTYHDGPLGRMRVRSVGTATHPTPEVVVIQGMAVSDYLVPAVRALGAWTRAHLLDLPGLAGSGDAPRPLAMADYVDAVTDYLDATAGPPRLLGGHSAGTQFAAHAARRRTDVAGLVLASPTVDPVARSLPALLARFVWNGRLEDPAVTESHQPEWRRAGPRTLARLVLMTRADRIEDTLADVDFPCLAVRGRQDKLSTDYWVRSLSRAPGAYHELPGAHGFVWSYPNAWGPPLQVFAAALS